MRTFSRWLSLAITAAILSSALCAAPPPTDKAPPGNAPILIPNMQATGQFFSGALTVDVRFGRMERPRNDAQPGPDGKPAQPSDAPPDKKSGGGKRKGGGKGGPPPGGGGSPRAEADPSERTPRIREEQNPPVQFHVTLTNNGATPLVVEVLDFDSALGNFAVKPDKITVAPGQSAQTDPMISRLGIPSEDIPLKIRVRAARATEQQTLTLKILPPPQDQPPPQVR